MIKFLRKIRQTLLSENKFSKYLIYAIGEIILVVIGILIALSINNWNERQKRIADELAYLKRLQNDIEFSIVRTQSGAQFMLKAAEYATSIIDDLNNCLIPAAHRKNFVEGMFLQGKLSPPLLMKGTIDELESTGKLLSIRNVQLREQLTNVVQRYEEDIAVYSQLVSIVSPSLNYINNHFSFKIDKAGTKASDIEWNDVIFDLNGICQDRQFIASLLTIQNYTYDNAGWNQRHIERLKSLKSSIEKELELKDKIKQ